MQFLHITLLPSIVFIFSVILQLWFNKEEFIEYYKLYFLGIASGIVFLVLSSVLNVFFAYSANHVTVFLRSLIIDGFLFAALACTALYFIVDLFVNNSITATWSLMSIMSFSYISGIYTSINISHSLAGDYPDNILFYLSFLSLLVFLSLVLGIGLPKFMDAYDVLYKVLWGLFTVGIMTVVLMAYSYLLFYNYIYHYLMVLVTGVFLAFFEVNDFRLFRR